MTQVIPGSISENYEESGYQKYSNFVHAHVHVYMYICKHSIIVSGMLDIASSENTLNFMYYTNQEQCTCKLRAARLLIYSNIFNHTIARPVNVGRWAKIWQVLCIRSNITGFEEISSYW